MAVSEQTRLRLEFDTEAAITATIESGRFYEVQLIVDAVADDDYEIFQGELTRLALPKKVRVTSKKSIYKGVSANGKKWQVSQPTSLTVCRPWSWARTRSTSHRHCGVNY